MALIVSRLIWIAPFLSLSGAFVCGPWPDDFCPSNGSTRDGCSPGGYALLPAEPDWMGLRARLVKEIFGHDDLPASSRPTYSFEFTVQHRFPDCLSSVWEDGSVSGCEKPVPVTELVWVTTARLNASHSKNLTSRVFLTLNTSGWAPGPAIWGPDQPQAPVPPRRGKTLVIFHHGHGTSIGCVSYGDTDGTTDWLNQMGYDVATMMMPFHDCNTAPDDPPELHAWFKNFQDLGLPWVRFFLDPVIKTINFAKVHLGYERIVMMGLSGGGWTTTLAAALDARIDLSIPIAGSLPCDFRHTSWDFEQFCDDRWAQIGNYTALYALAALEAHRTSVQVLHEADPCCFHGCGRHERIEDFNRYVRGRAAGLFRTVVTEGNMHEVNPRDKIVAGILIEKISRGKAISPADLQTPFNLLAELERPTEQSAFVI